MIKRSPRPDTHFVMIANHVVRDGRLSFKARGILTYLLSMPDNWKISATNLAKVGGCGRDAIESGLKELEDAGYIKRWYHRGQDGKYVHDSIVYDTPMLVDKPVDIHVDIPLERTDPCGLTATENPAFKEVPNKKKLEKELVLNLSHRDKTICTKCNGTSWKIIQGLDLQPCDCDAGIVRVH